MKKFIKSIIILVPISIVIYMVFIFIWGTFLPNHLKGNMMYRIGTYGHMYSRTQEVRQKKNIDILFVGSSSTYRGFDTRIYKELGYEAFNLGSSSQTPIQTKLLLERYLGQLNPKLIIFDVSPVTFYLDGVESSCDIIANDRNDIYSLKMALSINNIKVYNTLIFGFINDIFNLNHSFIEEARKGKDQYISGGFVQADASAFKKSTNNDIEYPWRLQQLQAFKDILEMTKGREIILVRAPITTGFYRSISNNNSFDSLMLNYGNYINFNEILSLVDSLCFLDHAHLNQVGVKQFNDKLIEELHLEDKTKDEVIRPNN